MLDLLPYFLLGIVAMTASFATFFSGFGLGTLLLPVFTFFFSIEIAILATAIVHFINSIFKFSLTIRSIDLSILVRFGIAAGLGAGIGSFTLKLIGNHQILFHYVVNNHKIEVEQISFIIGLLMLIFAGIELIPCLKNKVFDKKWLPLGGLISGFFGGFSGHQGALRSAFLSKTDIDQKIFISTSICMALIIDLIRVSFYFQGLDLSKLPVNMILFGCFFALLGSILGKRYFDKKKNVNIRMFVAIFLFSIGTSMVFGII